MLDLAIVDYEITDHTADICVRVYGDSVEELFKNAARAMMEITTNTDKVNASKEISLEIQGENNEELLVKWLQEILFIHEVNKMVFKDFQIKFIDENHALGKAYGETIDIDRHEFYSDIKAVTYHNLKITSTKDKLTVDIVFDI